MTERTIGWADALAGRVRARIDPGRPAAEEHVVTSRDGWPVGLRRLLGARTGRPVVLCHGFGGNSRSFDLPGCLGPFLAERGFDVFLVDLSGVGGGRGRAPRITDWQADAVEVAAAVLRLSGARDLAWVGHSLGGWLGLTSPFGAAAPSLVIGLGTTLFFDDNPALARALAVARTIGRVTGGDVVPQATLGALEAPLMGRVALPAFLSWVSPPGVRGELARQLHALAVEDLPLPIAGALEAWAEKPTEAEVHLARAVRSQADVVLFAGRADAWAPPRNVERTAALLAPRAARTEVVWLGEPGAEERVRHADYLFGAARRTRTFEPIARCLVESTRKRTIDPPLEVP